MIETRRVPCKWEEEYIVNGITFNSYREAESYQNLLDNPNVLETLEFVSSEGEVLVANDFIRERRIPDFCYLKVTEDLPFDIYVTSFLCFINNNQKICVHHSESNDYIPTAKGIYYNNYTNAWSGGWGNNGFERIRTLEKLEKDKSEIESKIEKTKKIYNYFKKPIDK